ncbi:MULTISPECIES: hypothetical protein [unclassified Salinibacterium]|uniref:hypothetical protein n=1 Tax=unclassified Salinibacterium TaxID=2632331 RepID=UPI0018CCAE93|nr:MULTISPECIES: hypothetical protein [unclassified Salinibacterium]MBH0053122.1 hypothetical protein [Salinibacterium sp. SWN139]MBH0082388.1 hypothetical protein [Salinibacterium sp. SWN167]
MVLAAYPYIKVTIDTRGLQPRATRAVGNIGIVGSTGGAGSATPNLPLLVTSEQDARVAFATTNPAGAIAASGRLYKSVATLLRQDPAPSRVYAVPTDDSGGTPDYSSALVALEAADVQFVLLAGEYDVDALGALADHVENVSNSGKRRIAVAAVDPELDTSGADNYAAGVEAEYGSIKSDSSRMLLVAARTGTDADGVHGDAAAAACGTVAGYAPHISILMKQVRGLDIALQDQFSASDISQLSEGFIVPIIDPELIVGDGLYLGAGRAYTSNTEQLYIDIVRVLDDIEYRLKAGLIGAIGNVRIDRLGIQTLTSRLDGILAPLKSGRVIDDYSIYIPIVPTLAKEEADRSPGEATVLTDTRLNRTVEVLLSVTYAGSIHTLDVQLALKA